MPKPSSLTSPSAVPPEASAHACSQYDLQLQVVFFCPAVQTKKAGIFLTPALLRIQMVETVNPGFLLPVREHEHDQGIAGL